MKKTARIAFLLGGFQDNGGIGRVTSIIANGMSKDSSKKVFTISYYQDERPFIYPLDGNVTKLFLYDTRYSMKDAFLKYQLRAKLKRILIDNSIDVLIACGALFFPVAVSATRGIETKCICWEHSNANNKSDHQFQMICRWVGSKFADAIVTLTKQDYSIYMDKFKPRQIYQIYNPLDELIHYSYNLKENPKKIISVGRLTYQKNYQLLLKVAKSVLDKKDDWTWDIYGEGPDRVELEDLSIGYGLTNRVFFKGQVDDLYNRYKDYSFYVITSRYEGFGMALLEANRSGLPIISFDVECGPREIISNGKNGFLVEPLDETEMINRILELCNNRDLCLEFSANIKRMDNPFQLSVILKRWDEVLSCIIDYD